MVEGIINRQVGAGSPGELRPRSPLKSHFWPSAASHPRCQPKRAATEPTAPLLHPHSGTGSVLESAEGSPDSTLSVAWVPEPCGGEPWVGET